MCLPPARMHFCVLAARLSPARAVPGSACPTKRGLNWFYHTPRTRARADASRSQLLQRAPHRARCLPPPGWRDGAAPAFANSSVGSPTGTTGDELTSVWSCFSSKYDVNVCRTFAAGQSSDAHDALVEASDMCVVANQRAGRQAPAAVASPAGQAEKRPPMPPSQGWSGLSCQVTLHFASRPPDHPSTNPNHARVSERVRGSREPGPAVLAVELPQQRIYSGESGNFQKPACTCARRRRRPGGGAGRRPEMAGWKSGTAGR